MAIYRHKKYAARALAALRGKPTYGSAANYYNHSERHLWQEIPDDGITELLVDLRHLCDVMQLDFAHLDSRAYSHYADEKASSQ